MKQRQKRRYNSSALSPLIMILVCGITIDPSFLSGRGMTLTSLQFSQKKSFIRSASTAQTSSYIILSSGYEREKAYHIAFSKHMVKSYMLPIESQPRGGKILTFIWDHHKDAFHRTALCTKAAADATVIHKLGEQISVSSALSLPRQIEGAYRACLNAYTAAYAVFIMKIRCFFECHITPPSICLYPVILSSQGEDVLSFHPTRKLSSALRPVLRF